MWLICSFFVQIGFSLFFPHKSLKIKQLLIKQMRRSRVHQGAEHDLAASGAGLFPIIEDFLNLLALQNILGATQIAGDDRVVHGIGKVGAIGLGDMGQRPVDEQVARLVEQFWRHGGEATTVKQVHEEGFENVIAMVAQNYG